MSTIKDVAKAVGVSSTTISNAIHGRRSRLSDETLVQINNAIREMGYVPNMSARSLVNRSSKLVGLIKSGSTDTMLSSGLTEIIEESLRHEGYYLMLRSVSGGRELLSFLRNWNLDGLLLTGSLSPELGEVLSGLDIPVVLVGTNSEALSLRCIDSDDFHGGYQAATRLIRSGHRRIAFASPPLEENRDLDRRLRGYKTALEEAGLPFDPKLIISHDGDHNPYSVGIELGEALSRQAEPFTAIVAASDITTAGILSYAQDMRIPDRLSIVGFDGPALDASPYSPPTVIRSSVSHMGTAAADCLLEQLLGNNEEKKKLSIPPVLIERGSVRTLHR